ncbi:MAG: HEAT repeat domain-containing protein [Armatimonadota bacterium]
MTAAADELEKWIGELAFPGSGRRDRAVGKLISIGPAAVPALCEAVVKGGLSTRWGAAAALAALRDPASVPALTRMLRDREGPLREQAALALGELGDPSAVPALLQALKRGDRFTRPRAAEALGKIGDPAAVPALIQAMRGWEFDDRSQVIEALGRLGAAEAVPVLRKAASGNSPYVNREAALTALARLGDVESIPVLCRVTWEEGEDPLAARVSALASFGERGVPLLIEQLHERGLLAGMTSTLAGRALVAIGSPAVPALCGSLGGGPDLVRAEIARLLGEIGDPRALDALVRLLQESETRLQEAGALALGKLGDARALEWLRPFAAAAGAPGAAALAVVELGDDEPRWIPGIVRTLSHDLPEARQRAAAALLRLAGDCPSPGLRSAVPALGRLCGRTRWGLEPGGEIYQAVLREIEARTAGLKDLPIPSQALAGSEETLPRPAEAPAFAEGLPRPAGPGEGGARG